MSIINSSFKVFNISFPDRKKIADFSAISAKKLKNKIPDELLQLLTEEGQFTFGETLFFFIDPLPMKTTATDWGLNPDNDYIFLRTAFGDFFYWDGIGVKVVHINSAVQNEVSSDIKDFLNFGLPDDKYNSKTLYGRFLKKAKENLGELKSDECYIFVPALPLGGKESATNLQIGKLTEYLAMLSELK